MWSKGKYQIITISILILQLLKEKDQTGVQLVQGIREQTGGVFSMGLGSLFPTFHTLENKGNITSYRKAEGRYYHIEESGLQFLSDSLDEFKEVDSGLRCALNCAV